MKDVDVAVVGAGAAGIAAALALRERAIGVAVLEARDRIGGRVLWDTVGSEPVPAELGAEFVHGDAPETSALLAEAGLERVETAGVSWSFERGELRPAADDFDGKLFERVRSRGDDESVAAFLSRCERDPHVRGDASRARAFVEGFEAADPALASARAIADEVRSGVDASSSRPIGSYAPLFEHLAARCERAAVEFHLHTSVERIVWERGCVTLETRDERGATRALRARAAIVTVPIGVLLADGGAGHIVFAPPLPGKGTAVRGLAMGHAVRVVTAYRVPFWEQVDGRRYRDAAFFRCAIGTFNAFWTQYPQRQRTIVAWVGGPRAMALAGMPEHERIERARDEFGDLFGRRDLARAFFEDAATHDWSADPYARGVYSYVVTGAGDARAALAASVDGTLFFAGEATATDGQAGTVSGAFGSGMRAARELAVVLGAAETA